MKLIDRKKVVSKDKIDDEILERLYLINFICYNNSENVDAFNAPMPDGTVSITNLYLRYKKHLRNSFIEKKLPIIISAIALVVSIASASFTYLQLLQK